MSYFPFLGVVVVVGDVVKEKKKTDPTFYCKCKRCNYFSKVIIISAIVTACRNTFCVKHFTDYFLILEVNKDIFTLYLKVNFKMVNEN